MCVGVCVCASVCCVCACMCVYVCVCCLFAGSEDVMCVYIWVMSLLEWVTSHIRVCVVTIWMGYVTHTCTCVIWGRRLYIHVMITHYNTQQHTATYRNKLQHTATYCNTLQWVIWLRFVRAPGVFLCVRATKRERGCVGGCVGVGVCVYVCVCASEGAKCIYTWVMLLYECVISQLRVRVDICIKYTCLYMRQCRCQKIMYGIQCVAVCCSVLQFVAVCCSVLQCVIVCDYHVRYSYLVSKCTCVRVCVCVSVFAHQHMARGIHISCPHVRVYVYMFVRAYPYTTVYLNV